MFVKSIVGLTLVALVAAQSGGNSANKTIDPAQVDASIRCKMIILSITNNQGHLLINSSSMVLR